MADLESRENPYNVTQASRIYVLIDSFLENPKGKLRAVLDSVTNSDTFDRTVLLPIPRRDNPKIFEVYEARRTNRTIKCTNPRYVPPAMVDVLSSDARNHIDPNSPTHLEWGAGSSIRSIERYFTLCGINTATVHPADYTDEAIYNRYVKSELNSGRQNKRKYPMHVDDACPHKH